MMEGVGPRRVLVVEDSPTQALELRLMLEAEGFEVAVADDGARALEALGASAFDVVLSDVVMPGLSGYDLCRAIKADPARRHIPVILLTTLKEPRDVALGLECGADNFIRKPYEPDYLADRIRTVLSADSEGAEDPFATMSSKGQVLNFLASTFDDFLRATRREHEQRHEAEILRLEAEAARSREALAHAEREAFRATEERFRAFMDNHHAVVYMKDEEGRLVYVNAPFLHQFGNSEADWLGKSDAQLWPEPVAAALRANDLAVLRSGQAAEVQEVMPTPSGGDRLWSASKFPFHDPCGRVLLGGIAVDVTDRVRAEQEIRTLNVRLERRLDRLNSLRRIDMTITSSHDLRATLEVVLDQVTSRLGVDAAAILLLNPVTHTLDHFAGRGFRGTGFARSKLRPGEGHAGLAVLEDRVVSVRDLREEGGYSYWDALVADENFVAYYAAPLVARGQAKGVLEVYHRGPLDPDGEWLDFLEALADQAAIAVEAATSYDELRRANAELTLAYDATIEGWARALDLRDKETEGHTRRVTEMVVRLAQAMGIRGPELSHIRRGAMLHDVGKLGIPDAILLKPGALDEGERRVMERHPVYAYEWLATIAHLRPALDIPYCHHERWDGMGYPRGLRREEIPLAARVFAAVDIYDALRSDRPYRAAWPAEKARSYVRSLAGNHLDPVVVDVFLHLIEHDDPSSPGVAAGVRDPSRAAGAATPPSDADYAALTARLEEQSALAARLIERVKEQARELGCAKTRLSELADPDALTGLVGRRNSLEALESAFAYAVRHTQPLSVVLLDLDRFREYNEAHGRPAGDGVLAAVARLARENVRAYDVAARYDGDELLVLLPATDARGGREFAERLRAAVAGHEWPHRRVTVSAGVATLTATTLKSIELVEEAQDALRQSKDLGRDRVTHFENVAAWVRGTTPARATAHRPMAQTVASPLDSGAITGGGVEARSGSTERN